MNFDPITREYHGDAHKLLSDNRAAYIAQSAASRHGEVAPFNPIVEEIPVSDAEVEAIRQWVNAGSPQ